MPERHHITFVSKEGKIIWQIEGDKGIYLYSEFEPSDPMWLPKVIFGLGQALMEEVNAYLAWREMKEELSDVSGMEERRQCDLN